MKLASILFAPLVAAALLAPGCSDDPDVSVTRDTDELNFAYSVSTQSFTVRTEAAGISPPKTTGSIRTLHKGSATGTITNI